MFYPSMCYTSRTWVSLCCAECKWVTLRLWIQRTMVINHSNTNVCHKNIQRLSENPAVALRAEQLGVYLQPQLGDQYLRYPSEHAGWIKPCTKWWKLGQCGILLIQQLSRWGVYLDKEKLGSAFCSTAWSGKWLQSQDTSWSLSSG